MRTEDDDEQTHLAHAALPEVSDAVHAAREGPDGERVRRVRVHDVADERAQVRARDDAVAVRAKECVVEVAHEEHAAGVQEEEGSVRGLARLLGSREDAPLRLGGTFAPRERCGELSNVRVARVLNFPRGARWRRAPRGTRRRERLRTAATTESVKELGKGSRGGTRREVLVRIGRVDLCGAEAG